MTGMDVTAHRDEKAPAITVIVPVYKGVRYLREALESLKAQTFRDWECICVDDESKDGSGALADEIALSDARFRVIHQPNGGTSVARNTALKVVRGEYVAFLDEDDVYEPRMLEVLHTAAVRTGADVVGCERLRVPDGESLHVPGGPVPPEADWKVADRRTLADWTADMYPGVPYEIWRNLYRREVIAGHWFVPGMRVEQDLMWHYTLLPRIAKYVKIDWPGYRWRMTDAGGYLHPDPASLVSLTHTYRHLMDAVAVEIGMDDGQMAKFALRMSQELVVNVWQPLRKGVRLDRRTSAELRRGFRALQPYDVDVRRDLEFKKRLKWTLFMLTGSTWWVRI